MSANQFIIHNGAMVTTAPPVAQNSGIVANTPRTMLQVAPSAATPFQVWAWGYTLTAGVPAVNPHIELIETDVACSGLTAHVAAGIQKWNVPANPTPDLQLGTALTGYSTTGNATTEGTITASREFDYNKENGLYLKREFSLGREPVVAAGKFLRIRISPGDTTALAFQCWVAIEI